MLQNPSNPVRLFSSRRSNAIEFGQLYLIELIAFQMLSGALLANIVCRYCCRCLLNLGVE